MILSALAGFFLAMAGVTFLLWQPPSSAVGTVVAMATHLSDHQETNFLYVISVFLSVVLFLPIILILTIRLYPKRPNGAIIAGSFFVLGSILETVAMLASLSQWTFAVPDAATGDPFGIKIYQTLTLQYLAVDFSGVGLIYVAAVIYAVVLWKLHRASSVLLVSSTLLLLIGFAILPFLPSASSTISAGSIVVFGGAYVTLGHSAVRLNS
jgi:hypothetical protein